jgi:predicted transglutaminase-like cysteine proteinase
MNLRKIVSGVLILFSVSVSNAKIEQSFSLADTNDFWNKSIVYKDEPISVSGKSLDFWQTPRETLSKKSGDCEDFAIIKYYDLIASGIEKEKLSLAWVVINNNDSTKNKYKSHVVLIYDMGSTKWVLDNYSSEIIDLNARTDFVSILAILNHDGAKIINGNGQKIKEKWNGIIKDFDDHVSFMKNLKYPVVASK